MAPHQHLGDDDEIDRLLAQARWPQPSVEQLDRLTERWRSARRRRARLVYSGCAIAASLLLTVGIRQWHNLRTASPPTMAKGVEPAGPAPPGAGPAGPATVAIAPASAAAETAGSRPGVDPIVVREPNIYERVLMTSAPARRGAAATKRQQAEFAVEELIAALAAEVGADVSGRLPTGEQDRVRFERLLSDIISNSAGERRLGATRLLVQVATPRSIPILLVLANDPLTHEVVVPGLGRLASSRELARLASVEYGANLRSSLLRMLLERRTAESVGLYLGFVDNADLRASALAAVAETTDPPLEQLLAYVQSPQRSMRLAAAQTLAQLPEPEVARRLSELALDPVARQEALIGLLLSCSAQADNFLNHARHDLYLMASVYAAEQELQSLTASSGGNLR